MSLYPLFADLNGRDVLVVGGGEVAARKTRALLQAGARVSVGAPILNSELTRWVADRQVTHLPGHFRDSWLDGMWLVIAATSKHATNSRIAAAAEQRRMLANVVDTAALCSFHVPAIVDRSPLTIAISSAGAAPVLARRIRERLEAQLDPSLGGLADLAGRYRARIRKTYRQMPTRRQFYNWLLDGPVARQLRRQQPQLAEQTLDDALASRTVSPARGQVTLVGAGPGDPGLLTMKAQRVLSEADVILHDRLVSDAIIDLARRDARRIDVGKRVGENHAATQARIHRLLVAHARAGARVVRLKGGDPFIFGRGGEELEYLRAHAIDYEVVPGISAAMACAAYAGVPLTHREHAQSVHLTTIHRKQALDTQDWQALAREHQTLAIYMGVSQLERLTGQLLKHGRDAATPFALIENGTRSNQRVITGSLEQLPARARQAGLQAPALLILGEVAALAPQLGWFGEQPDDMADGYAQVGS